MRLRDARRRPLLSERGGRPQKQVTRFAGLTPCNYIYDTHGRFPAHCDAIHVPACDFRGHHVELEYYHRLFRGGPTQLTATTIPIGTEQRSRWREDWSNKGDFEIPCKQGN